MNLLRTLKKIGRDILGLDGRVKELEGFYSGTSIKELDTGWIDIKEMLNNTGAWEAEVAFCRRKGDWVYFDVIGKVRNTPRDGVFTLGTGFNSPWNRQRSNVGTQPPEFYVANGRISWLGFVTNFSSVVAGRSMYKTDDPFPMHLLKKD